MNQSHTTTVLFADRTMQIRRCGACAVHPYQLWRRETGDPRIDGFYPTADAALAALMTHRAATTRSAGAAPMYARRR